MDILDEKANGGPPMEVEEVISVRNREFLPHCKLMYSSVASLSDRRGIRSSTHAGHGPGYQRLQSVYVEAERLEKAREEDYQSRI
jgi:hypothetical protein